MLKEGAKQMSGLEEAVLKNVRRALPAACVLPLHQPRRALLGEWEAPN